jgi:hypothetical protein
MRVFFILNLNKSKNKRPIEYAFKHNITSERRIPIYKETCSKLKLPPTGKKNQAHCIRALSHSGLTVNTYNRREKLTIEFVKLVNNSIINLKKRKTRTWNKAENNIVLSIQES